MNKFNLFVLKFSRVTSGQRLMPEIDGLRFFAIFTVLIFHLNTAFSRAIGSLGAMGEGVAGPLEPGWWIIRMDLGVKVFFAISGFILALPFIKHFWMGAPKVNLKAYLIRRLTRLEPPYIIALTLFLGVHVLILGASFKEYLPNYLISLVYLHNIIFDRSSIILPVAWSLEVEVQFYLLIPIFSAFIFKPLHKWRSFVWMMSLIAITILTKHYIMSNSLVSIGSSILVYFSHFGVGIVFAMIYLLNKPMMAKRSYIWDLIGLVSTFLLFYFYKPQKDIANNIVFNFGIYGLFLSVFKGKLTNYIYSLPIIFVIGGMCYTIYLIHFPLLLLMTQVSKKLILFEAYYGNLVVQFLILIPAVIIISAIFYKLFEQPFMDKTWPGKFKVWVRSIKKA